MNTSTATADTPLRQAWPQIICGQAGRLAPRDLDVLFQVRLALSELRVPVSPGVWAVSSLDPSASLGVEPERGRRLDCARDPEL
ncbi:MAG: hypothetical protein OEY28_10780, partial [Nitrospira sp.]|nr:hypothetical protein [Nitrospira sp.]